MTIMARDDGMAKPCGEPQEMNDVTWVRASSEINKQFVQFIPHYLEN